MAEINDQSSDTSSDCNWPLDAALEGHQHDRVVFENVADQYVKGENVTAFFTILQDIKVNADEDQIGLLRVGSTNIKECLAYAPVQFNPSTVSGAIRHGTATFPSSSVPVTDDEFYQFCYILNKTKNVGLSICFQLNCAPDDIDLLSNTPVRKTKSDVIALVDRDNDDVLVIHTKSTLNEGKLRQENRKLLDDNRRLESQKEECQVKLELQEVKQKEQFNKLHQELQSLIAARKAANEEILSRQQGEAKLQVEFDACRSLCRQYQSEVSLYADRCRVLEETQAKIVHDTNQTRNQLTVQSQFTKDQATQIVDLERRLMQADEVSKNANQRQATLEQRLRDLYLTAEKHQMSMQAQLEEFKRLIVQRDDQINALDSKNQLLKDELVSLETDNECLALESKQNKDLVQDLQQQLQEIEETYQEKIELVQNELQSLRTELNEKESDSQAYAALKTAFSEIEKRCVKHQKSELEAKRKIAAYQQFQDDLQREVQDLTERLAAGAEEYRVLFRKYTTLEQSVGTNEVQEKFEPITTITTTNETDFEGEELYSVLRNTDYDEQVEVKDEEEEEEEQRPPVRNPSAQSSLVDAEVQKCPMCDWEFPEQMTVDGKREHIEQHFD